MTNRGDRWILGAVLLTLGAVLFEPLRLFLLIVLSAAGCRP